VQIGRSVNWAEETIKLAVKINVRNCSGGSAASVHRLRLGVVRSAPRIGLRADA